MDRLPQPPRSRTRQGPTRRRPRTARGRARTHPRRPRARDAKPKPRRQDEGRARGRRIGPPSAPCATTRRWAAGCGSSPSGRLVIDRAKIAAEERLDGKYLLSTSDPDLSAEDVALGYKNLLEAERGFRDLKSTLELRPVFHRIEPRIRAHVLLCWLALLLVRVAERRTGHTWRRINTELGRVHAVTLHGPAGTVEQTTVLTDAQTGILGACERRPAAPRHPPPPRLSRPNTLTPASPRVDTRAPTTDQRVPAGHTPDPSPPCAHQLRNPG